MKLHRLLRNFALAAVFGALALAAASPAHASANTVIWTDWTSGTFVPANSPTAGSATGTMGGITVNYAGQITSIAPVGGNFFDPSTPYIGGVITNAPTVDAVAMTGPYADTETITFSSPVTNPVMALWSLGSTCPGNVSSSLCMVNPVVFIFSDSFTLEAGGDDGFPPFGQSIEACTGTAIDGSGATIGTGCSAIPGSTGTVAYGLEGSGSILFTGTYNSISFTTPDDEAYYGFDAGYVTPEPETLSLLGLGLLALPLLRASLARRRRA